MTKILMLENDKKLFAFLKNYLENYKIIFEEIEDLNAFLNYDFSSFDLLILDLDFPFENLNLILKQLPIFNNLPIIVSSDKSSENSFALKFAADYHIKKPYDPKELYAVIQTLIKRKYKHEKLDLELRNICEDKIKIITF